jgi:hypothetical protein
MLWLNFSYRTSACNEQNTYYMCCVSGGQYKSFSTTYLNMLSKGKAIPIQAWIGPVGSRKFRHPEFLDSLNVEVARLIALHTWLDNKVWELIAVNHHRRLQSTPLGNYAPMPAPNPPFKTILELVLWNGLQSYYCITRDVIKMPSLNISFIFGNRKKVIGG